MKKKYKICFVGVGSIARRHIKNIVEYMQESKAAATIDVLRSGKGEPLDIETERAINRIYYSINEILDKSYDVVFITNPTANHAEAIKRLSTITKSFFIEKPIFHTSKINLNEMNFEKDKVYYVACPLRHTKVIKYLKNNIDFNEVLSLRAISSSYLPDWRKDRDYRKSYSAKKHWEEEFQLI